MNACEILREVDYCVTHMRTELAVLEDLRKKLRKECGYKPAAFKPFRELIEDNSEEILSVRLLHALKEVEVIDMTPADFCYEFPKKDFARVKNVGKKTLQELVTYVKALGIDW